MGAGRPVKDAQGKLKYTVEDGPGGRKDVRDAHGARKGYVKDGRTYDNSGKMTSMGEDISSIPL